jgi:hypothetical protein
MKRMELKQDKLIKKNKIPGEREMEIWRGSRGRRNVYNVEEKISKKKETWLRLKGDNNALSKTFLRVRHTPRREPNGTELPVVQWGPSYVDRTYLNF